MALVGFAILFAGVIDGYIAAASLVLILTFVIAAMVEANAGEIPDAARGLGARRALLADRDLRHLADAAARRAAARRRGGARRAGRPARRRWRRRSPSGWRATPKRNGSARLSPSRLRKGDGRRAQRLRLAAAPAERRRRADRRLRPARRRPRLVRRAGPRAARAGLGQRRLRRPSARRSKRRSRRRCGAPPSGCAPTTPATAGPSSTALQRPPGDRPRLHRAARTSTGPRTTRSASPKS